MYVKEMHEEGEMEKKCMDKYMDCYGIGYVMWFLIIGYHIMIGQAGGATAYVNLVLEAILAAAFFYYSRKTE